MLSDFIVTNRGIVPKSIKSASNNIQQVDQIISQSINQINGHVSYGSYDSVDGPKSIIRSSMVFINKSMSISSRSTRSSTAAGPPAHSPTQAVRSKLCNVHQPLLWIRCAASVA